MEAKFNLGQLVATPNAIETHGNEAIQVCLTRHLSGDWGDLSQPDLDANNRALDPDDPGRIHSSYKLPTGKLWILTEYDRSVTTVLCPEDY